MSLTTPGPHPGPTTDAPGPGVSERAARAIRSGRVVLLAVGLLLLAWGVYVLFDTVRLPRITGLAIWIVAAIVLHDLVLAPLLFGAGLLLRRAGRTRPGLTLPGTVIAVVQGTLVVGSMMSLIVVPMLVAQNFTPDNPTILPLNYGLNLGLFWLAALTAGSALSVWLYRRARRANDRPPSTQD